MRPFGRAAAGATARLATRRGRAAGVLDVSERGRSMTPRIVVMAESAIDAVTLSERFDASDLDSEYLRARLFEPPVVGGWRCPSGRASWRRGVRCRRAQSRGRYEAIQPGRSRDGPVDDLRDRVEMIQKTQGALGRRGWREPPVEGRGAGFPSRGPQLACRRQPRRSQSWHCDHADSAGRMTARRRPLPATTSWLPLRAQSSSVACDLRRRRDCRRFVRPQRFNAPLRTGEDCHSEWTSHAG